MTLPQVDIITRGADRGGREIARRCPFCGADPGLSIIHYAPRKYFVGCEADGCPANPQVCGATGGEAWALWNTRAEARAK